MKKTLLAFVALLLLINFAPNQAEASTLSCYQVDGMAIFGYDYDEWVHIGAIGNEFNSLSIANKFGAGNEFKSSSIFNEFGKFGSDYSSYSAFNDYASNPPIIVNDNYKFVGYMTTNDYKTPSINTYEAIACAKNSFRSPDRDMEDITFKSIPSGYSGGSYSSGYLPTPPVSEYTCPKNSHTSTTDVTKCDCDSGYKVNSSKDVCVRAPAKTNEQICQDNFGGNVIWDGTKNDDDTLNCNCKSGYLWNTGRTACEVYINTNPAGCTSGVGFSPTTGMSCDGTKRCSDNMQLNSNKTECIPIPIVIQPKKVEQKLTTPTISTKSEVKAPTEIKAEENNEVTIPIATEPTTTESSTKPKWYIRIFKWLF